MADTVSTQDVLPAMQEGPEPSCVSMRSNQSIEQPVNLKDKINSEHSRFQKERSDSPELSCVSMRSVQSIEQPVNLKDKDNSDHGEIQQERSDFSEPDSLSLRSRQSIEQPVNLKNKDNSKHGIQPGRSNSPEPNCVSVRNDQTIEQPLKTTENSNGSQLVKALETLKSNMKKKFLCLSEGISKQENPTPLNEIYTELYITEGETGEISNEHEARQIETQFRRAVTEETAIKCNDIFKPLSEQDKPIRSVLTKGVAGIGKTVSVQKFILDWAEGRANQDIHLIFPLPFRELNLMKDKKLRLLDLLHIFFPETKEIELSGQKFVFIFDGLDECRLSLDFHSCVKLCDVSESASVDVMLTNLIKGNLLPSALIWITSRPAAADLIPSEFVDRITEVRGFSDPQKEEYFRKRISDESLSNRIISHVKSSRSLYIMCHIPVFCWISATVLQRMLNEACSEEIPKTLTQMYTHFLIIQTNIKCQKDYERKVTDEDVIFKLGKLAFEQLVKGNLIFYEEDLRNCDIDVAEASVYSGLCSQIFREEFGLYQGKVYCFVHLSIQEHLAALYVHLTFVYKSVNAFTHITKSSVRSMVLDSMKHISLKHPLCNLHQRAVDEALKSENGHLDLFLRFLLGLSVESNQILLQSLTIQTSKGRHSNKETVDYIKQKIRKISSPEKSINLFYCLNELGYHSLMEEIKHYLKSGAVKTNKLSSSQWSALVFVLLTSEQRMDVFNLYEFVGAQKNPDEVLLKLMPVVKTCKAVKLLCCSIKGCDALASALKSNSSQLTELDLTLNKVGVSGVKLLCAGLEDHHCKLSVLCLKNCGITDEGCAALASALRLNPSHLTQLLMSRNKFGDSGVKHLSSVFENCKLQKLCFVDCGITDEGCVALASALRLNPTHMREVILNWNTIRDSGVKLLSSVLADPQCKLERLGLGNCGITDKGCNHLASALRSNPSHLTQLNLSENKLGDSGVKLLSAVLENPQVKLESIGLNSCGITDEGCLALASALTSNPSHLRKLGLFLNKLPHTGMKLLFSLLENNHCNLEKLWLSHCEITDEGCSAMDLSPRSTPSHLTELDLSHNKLNSGVKWLCAFIENPYCRLEILRLDHCGVSDEGCAALASVLRLNTSLLNLSLFYNKFGHSGVKLLTAGLENPQCKLKTLHLVGCGITDEGCVALASALKSNPSHLKELNVSVNKVGDSGVKRLCDALENPHCKLEVLRLSNCGVTAKGCDALVSALKSNPSHLRHLDLFKNSIEYSGMNLLFDLKNSPDYNLDTIFV